MNSRRLVVVTAMLLAVIGLAAFAINATQSGVTYTTGSSSNTNSNNMDLTVDNGPPVYVVYSELADNHSGIPTFTAPDGRLSGTPRIPIGTRVLVGCFVPNNLNDGYLSVNDWYLILWPSPWTHVWASANTFANGAPLGVNTTADPIDTLVPRCLAGNRVPSWPSSLVN